MLYFKLVILGLVAASNLSDLRDSLHLLLDFVVFGFHFLLQSIPFFHHLICIISQTLNLSLQRCCQITGPVQRN